MEFAHPKRSSDLESTVARLIQEEANASAQPERKEKEVAYNPPIIVQYKVEDDDVYEKVSAFERKMVPMTYEASNQLRLWKQLAPKSEGIYDAAAVSFYFCCAWSYVLSIL